MSAGQWTFFDNWHAAVGKAVDLSSDTLKVTLHTSTFSPSVSAMSVYADLTNELATANGYTNGGITLSGVTFTQTSGTGKLTSTAPVWTASGGSITARYAVLRASGTFNSQIGPLIAYCLLDSADVTATDGGTFTITPAANGYFTVTG